MCRTANSDWFSYQTQTFARMRFYSYLNSAKTILGEYDGSIPFAAWLKQHFKSHKKFGSRDRKIVSNLCYSYFRLGKLFNEKSVEDRLIRAQFLCHDDSELIKELKPEWGGHLTKSIDEKLNLLKAETDLVFPFVDELSDEIEKHTFVRSHLIQPDLFLRIRPGKQKTVIQKLEQAAVSFSIEGDCIRVSNATKIDEVLEVDTEVVVQDKSSQQVINPFKEHWKQNQFMSWDCCAASGGKTILLYDHFPKAQLTVSDIRESILLNLKNRFGRAGIQQYQSFIADVSSSQFSLNKKFDIIICDAPCSGSGTWGRTPEQLSFFQKEKIDYYADLQKRIAVNASGQLKQGGCLLYITCSVFKKENEDVVANILVDTNLQLLKQEYFKGYTEKADTLFAALFSL